MTSKQSGFTIIEVVIIVVAVALVGYLGYVAYDRISNSNDAASVEEQSTTAEDVKTDAAPAEVKDTSDLDDALKALDGINSDATSADTKLIDDHVAEF